jgi:hypothetical protein
MSLLQVKIPRKRLWVVLLGLVTFLAALVLITADYHSGPGVYRIIRVPFFTVDVGRSERWMVRSGINFVSDQGRGMAGNVVEFPICPGYRVGIRYYSRRWWQEEHAK